MQINDPLTHDTMRVTSDGHAEVSARTTTIAAAEAFLGNAYNFNTGSITLTNASTANGIAWIKNTTTSETYVITAMFYLFGNSTSGTGDGLMEVLRNPTTGTVVSDASTQAPVNRDFGSAKTLTGSFFKASGSGKTITDGTVAIESLFSAPTGRAALTVGAIIIPPGASIGWRYTTQASNSSQSIQVACAIHRQTLDKHE